MGHRLGIYLLATQVAWLGNSHLSAFLSNKPFNDQSGKEYESQLLSWSGETDRIPAPSTGVSSWPTDPPESR